MGTQKTYGTQTYTQKYYQIQLVYIIYVAHIFYKPNQSWHEQQR